MFTAGVASSCGPAARARSGPFQPTAHEGVGIGTEWFCSMRLDQSGSLCMRSMELCEHERAARMARDRRIEFSSCAPHPSPALCFSYFQGGGTDGIEGLYGHCTADLATCERTLAIHRRGHIQQRLGITEISDCVAVD